MPDDRRRLLLRAALGFLRLPATEPELVMLHRWLDTWTGVGLITLGVERHAMRLSLSHIAEGEWRAMFMDDKRRQGRGQRVRGRNDAAVAEGKAEGLDAAEDR